MPKIGSGENAVLQSSGDQVERKSLQMEKESQNKDTEENTHTKALGGSPSKDNPSPSDKNPELKGGCSTADMAPLEFKKRLFVDIERYPNLLKRYQEGKVKVHESCTEDERFLNKIKQKVISSTEFKKYLSDLFDQSKKLLELIILKIPPAETSDDESTGSSGEGGDNLETDPNYNPTKDEDNEDTPSKPKRLRPKVKVITHV